jgi:hypothetical protein
MLGKLDGFPGIVRASARHDGDALGGDIDAQLDNALVLGMRQGRRFTGGPDGDEPSAAFGDLPFDMGGEGCFIDSARIGEGGNESGNGSPEHARLLKAWHFTLRPHSMVMNPATIKAPLDGDKRALRLLGKFQSDN